MKAVKIVKPKDVIIEEVKMPVPRENEALIKVKAAGICGSDIGAFRGTNGLVTYPRIIGHEIAGEVVSVPKSNPKNIKVGDKVIVDPYLYCGHCYPCGIKRTNCCESLKVLGVHVDGGMSEYFCHPANMLIKMPDEMSWVQAALAEPLTISTHGIHRGKLKADEYCVIIGAGPIGMAAGMVAQNYGAHAILLDLVQERLDFARSLGIEHTINISKEDPVKLIHKITNGVMAQQVMECSGANAAIRNTLDYVSYAGRITLTGWPKTETSLPTDMITKKELDIRGARTSAGEFEEAVDLICSKKVDMLKLLTKTVPIDEAADVIKDIERNPQNYMKVVVSME
ncbi:zinc-binding alcohol dehydrogenase family protein [Treponema parvum]|uniref:Zinc-binding alcohol dehydrogenase family protein n=1 Tax=Treponema parvum TaxID=138851 RepID=A0A975F0E1_9SPIR|nr:zinc-binding alcohol dehydrogenase family protein [Treponema parvum]QTQ12290.1 zinc-binding alcohol dehydrogenase family protein [Treponema parvum]